MGFLTSLFCFEFENCTNATKTFGKNGKTNCTVQPCPLGHHDELHASPAKLSKTENSTKTPHSTPCSLEIHSPTITPSVVTVRALVKTGLNEGNLYQQNFYEIVEILAFISSNSQKVG